MLKCPTTLSAYSVAPEWEKLQSLAFPNRMEYMPEATVSLHARRHRNGDTRLVLVTLEMLPPRSSIGEMFLRGFSIIPGQWGSTPRLIRSEGLSEHDAWVFIDARVDMGQPDPADPTHFTIHVLGGVNGESPRQDRTIDGWLRDDDTVDLKFRPTVPESGAP